MKRPCLKTYKGTQGSSHACFVLFFVHTLVHRGRHVRALLFFVLSITFATAYPQEPLQRILTLHKQKGTVYELLGKIGEMSGYNFIYDSKIIDNERKVKMPGGNYTVQHAIYTILGNADYTISTFDKYILIDKKRVAKNRVQPPVPTNVSDSVASFIAIQGTVLDKLSGEPVAGCSVSIENTGIGTVVNNDGRFELKLPVKYKDALLHVSHIGYDARQIPVALFSGGEQQRTIYVNQRIIPLQEVIVRMVNPRKIVQEAVEFRNRNYPQEPTYLTSFYREGIEKKQALLYLTEAVFKVFKPAYLSASEGQIKLLKMRKITNQAYNDTLILKMQAGPEASLLIDLMKNLPDFMDVSDQSPFNYTKIDMTEYDSHLAHVVAFEPKENVSDPMYRGRLYIDANNSALLRAEFEIDSRNIDKAASLFVVKQGKGIKIKPQQLSYSVAYKQWNGRYYVNHLRGDLLFRIKQKHQLLYSPMHIFFESATCRIDTLDVKPFPRKERLAVNRILGDLPFVYDNAFWGDFNIILPEEKLSGAIEKISAKVETSVDDTESSSK